MMTFEALRIANDERQKEWDPNGVLTGGFHALELGGEVGEALNIVKKLERERLGVLGSRASAFDLARELADTVIVADLVARKFGIDLGRAVFETFNSVSDRNGLKTKIQEAFLKGNFAAYKESLQSQDWGGDGA